MTNFNDNDGITQKMQGRDELTHRTALIESICCLASYVPRRVLDDLLEDVRKTTLDNIRERQEEVSSHSTVLPLALSVIEYKNASKRSSSLKVIAKEPGKDECSVTKDSSVAKDFSQKSVESVEVAVQSQSFPDPFAEDDSDDNGSDGVRKAAIPSFIDPFPYDCDDDLELLRGHFDDKYQEHGTSASKFPLVLPFASQHRCALLLISKSGFTELLQILDVESLSKVSKTYFEIIVTEVIRHGGDILIFSGDTFVVEWPVFIQPSQVPPARSMSGEFYRQQNVGRSLEECTALALMCATSIATACSKFPVYKQMRGASEIGGRPIIGVLNATCGIAVGDVSAVHLGDNILRREFIIVGHPMFELTELKGTTSAGDVAVTPGALAILEALVDVTASLRFNSSRTLAIIATRTERFFKIKSGKDLSFFSVIHRELPKPLTIRYDVFDVRTLERLRQLISLYVHPVVAKEELAKPLNSSIEERFLADAELRDVVTVSIMPILTSDIYKDSRTDNLQLQRLNEIFLVINRELAHYGGQLKKIIVNPDQKGVMILATFGLRGSAFPNMISEHALPCVVAIQHALQIELGIESQVGETLGKTFCGMVGGSYRFFYEIFGPSINLSARLMRIPNHPGILVDNSVRLKANKAFTFNSFYPVGQDVCLIFEPIIAADNLYGGSPAEFVGRSNEISEICRTAEDVAIGATNAKMMYIQGEPGTGKSALIAQAISKISKIANKKVFVTRSVCKDGDRMIPFSMIRSTFKHVLQEMRDGPACIENQDSRRLSNLSAKSTSECTFSDSSESDSSLVNLEFLGNELDAPPEFVEIIANHLLGINERHSRTLRTAVKAESLDEIINFMALGFFRCTRHADIVVIALDDVHFLDELSWKVIKALFIQGRNILILCASRPLKSYKSEMDHAFWAALEDVYTRETRFKKLELAGLNESEVCDLISKKLEIPLSEIDSSFSNDIHVKSDGLPYFTTEILDAIRRNNLVTKLENGKFGWRADMSKNEIPDFNFETVQELTIYRLDSLEGYVSRTLHLCAVLGSEFNLSKLLLVCQNMKDMEKYENLSHAEVVRRALDVLVKDGILEEVYEGGQEEIIKKPSQVETGRQTRQEFMETESSCSDFADVLQPHNDNLLEENICYRFHHDMFRQTILELLLDTHKRRIHHIIAESFEEHTMGAENEGNDYYSMIGLFLHWKASGETTKAASLALSVGEILNKLCMVNQAVKMFDEALQMWTSNFGDPEDDTDQRTDFPIQVLNSMNTDDLKHILKLYVAKGQCYLSLTGNPNGCLQAFQGALSVIQLAPASADLKDRSLTFPVFSGFFALFKQGEIDQDKESTYEQEIVRLFVAETKSHADPVHYSRALGMQAEVLARVGRVAEALELFEQVLEIYDVDTHSAAISTAYGSDRVAQVFSLSILWNLQLGNEEKALATVDFVLNDLIPKMDIKNVHNSFLLLWPIYSVLKERGEAVRMKMLLEDVVIRPFRKYYGAESFTPFLLVHEPACMLLEICGTREIDDLDEKVAWILQGNIGVFNKPMDSGAGHFGKTCNQVTAEICLCLAKKVDDLDKKRRLIAKGTALARLTRKLCRGEYGTAKMPFAYQRNQPVLSALEFLVAEFKITEEMLSNKNYRYQD